MPKIINIAKSFNVSIWEILGVLCWKNVPVVNNQGFIRPDNIFLSSQQLEALEEFYVYPQIKNAVIEEKDFWYVGFINRGKERSIYKFVRSYNAGFMMNPEGLYVYNTLDYLSSDGELYEDGEIVVFQRASIFGYNVALNIRKYDFIEDKQKVIFLLFHGIRLSKEVKKELFVKSGVRIYELLKVFFEQKTSYKLEDDWWMKFHKFGRFIGLKNDWLEAVKAEYADHEDKFKEIFPLVQNIIHGVHNEVILKNKALYYILPCEEIVSLALEYKRKVIRESEDNNPEIKALTLLRYKNRLKTMSFDSLCDELENVYTQYSFTKTENNVSYESNYISDRDVWDAMTDGMCGDYPEEGFDGDYEFMGR